MKGLTRRQVYELLINSDKVKETIPFIESGESDQGYGSWDTETTTPIHSIDIDYNIEKNEWTILSNAELNWYDVSPVEYNNLFYLTVHRYYKESEVISIDQSGNIKSYLRTNQFYLDAPILTNDDRILFRGRLPESSYQEYVLCCNKDFDLLWTFLVEDGEMVGNKLLLLSDRSIMAVTRKPYRGEIYHIIYLIDANGVLQWKYDLPLNVSRGDPTIHQMDNGNLEIYFGSYRYIFDLEGNLIEEFKYDIAFTSLAIVEKDIFATSYPLKKISRIKASMGCGIDFSKGVSIYHIDVDGNPNMITDKHKDLKQIFVVENGIFIVESPERDRYELYLIKLDGSIQWMREIKETLSCAPVLNDEKNYIVNTKRYYDSEKKDNFTQLLVISKSGEIEMEHYFKGELETRYLLYEDGTYFELKYGPIIGRRTIGLICLDEWKFSASKKLMITQPKRPRKRNTKE